MEAEKIIKEKEIVYDDEHKDYASKGVAGAGLGLGIAGTALGLWALARENRGGLFGGGWGAGMPENVNINTNSGGGNSGVGAPTAFQAWEKGCQEALQLTNAIWGLHVSSMQADYDHRQTDIAEKFGLWKSQVDADFGLYKSQVDADFGLYKNQRDQFDNLKAQIDELKCQVAVGNAVRPYQDKLIMCEINDARKDAAYNLERRTCRMITGELVLPSTPTVTGFPSYNRCCQPTAPAPTA